MSVRTDIQMAEEGEDGEDEGGNGSMEVSKRQEAFLISTISILKRRKN